MSKLDLGIVTGAISSIVFMVIALLTSVSLFIVPVILFLCSILAIGIDPLRNRVHVCDICGAELEPLPVKYKKHTHKRT